MKDVKVHYHDYELDPSLYTIQGGQVIINEKGYLAIKSINKKLYHELRKKTLEDEAR